MDLKKGPLYVGNRFIWFLISGMEEELVCPHTQARCVVSSLNRKLYSGRGGDRLAKSRDIVKGFGKFSESEEEKRRNMNSEICRGRETLR